MVSSSTPSWNRRMIKTIARLPLPLLMLMLAALARPAAAEPPAPPAAFEKLVPRQFADGLRLVELKQRCTDCPAWRSVEVVPAQPGGAVRKEQVSVVDGVTAMYAYPGSGFFANTKIEKSAPGRYERDKDVLVEALEHVYAYGSKHAESYLKAHPEAKEKLDRIVAGREYMELERAHYRGVEYAALTQNALIANASAMPTQLHIFVPRDGVIVTAYLMKQQTTMFRTVDEFRRSQRAFIEGYIDFLVGAAAK
jgi:hypothetical protein